MNINDLLTVNRKMEQMEGWILDLHADNTELRGRFMEHRCSVKDSLREVDDDLDIVAKNMASFYKSLENLAAGLNSNADIQAAKIRELRQLTERVAALEAALEALEKK